MYMWYICNVYVIYQMEALKKKIELLTNQQNDLIIRIAGLSDPFLEIQAREEYEFIQQQITELQNQTISCILNDFKQEHLEEYKCEETNDLILALEKTNKISIIDEIKTKRIRIPTLADRRLLFCLAQGLDLRIDVYDLESCLLDTINTSGNKSVKLYVNCMKRYMDDPDDYYKMSLALK